MARALTSVIAADVNALHLSRELLWLFDLRRDSSNVSRYCDSNKNVTWNGNTYVSKKIEWKPFGEDAGGRLETVPITIWDADGSEKAYLFAGKYSGQRFAAHLVDRDHLSAATDRLTWRGFLMPANFDDEKVTLFAGGNDLRQASIPRQCLFALRCRYRFKDGHCGYVGGVSTPCDYLYTTCRATYANQTRFGGAPGLPRYRP